MVTAGFTGGQTCAVYYTAVAVKTGVFEVLKEILAPTIINVKLLTLEGTIHSILG